MGPLQQHFERCALLSLEKRERLLSLAGEHFLQLDLEGGMARFNDRFTMSFQVLGTESENTLTWLWAWAEEQTEMPEKLLHAARDMRSWLEREGLHELARPSVDLDIADGFMFATVAAEVCKAGAFYRDPYEGGALFILLFTSALERLPGLDRAGLVRLLRDLIDRYDLDHRNLVRSYLSAKGLPFTETALIVNAQLTSGERIMIEFGPAGDIERINGEVLR